MAKKYLSLQEAAELLNMRPDELNKLREAGTVRGFSDRGNWKFRFDDIESLKRERSVDSDPEVAIYDDEMAATQQLDLGKPGKDGIGGETEAMLDLDSLDDEDESVLSGLSGLDAAAAGGSSGNVLADDDPDAKGTVVSGDDFSTSDSDVRLIVDDSATTTGDDARSGSDSDVSLVPDSDSDVRIVGGAAAAGIAGAAAASLLGGNSDSDVKLVEDTDDATDEFDLDIPAPGNSDSEVRLADPVASDSDIRLDPSSSDSEVRLEGSDSEVRLAPESDEIASPASSGVVLEGIDEDESGIALEFEPGDDDDSSASVLLDDSSGVRLDDASGVLGAGESGISLELPSDSGVSLDADDEGLALPVGLDDADSGIALDLGDDSGISLEGSNLGLAEDSGIALESIPDSGIALDDGSGLSLADSGEGDFGGTVPMMDAQDSTDDVMDTAFDMSTDDSNFDLADSLEMDGDDLGDATQELDVADLGPLDDSVADSAFDMGEIGGGSETEDFGAGEFASDEFGTDEFGGDDQFESGEFGVIEGDDAFDDMDSGMSESGFASPGVRTVAAAEPEWGIAEVAPLVLTSVVMLGLGAMMLDLLNTMWAYEAGTKPATGFLLDLFKK